MLEYYCLKGFGILERNLNYLKKILNLAKQITHAEETHNSDHVMTFINTITFLSNTLNKLWLQSILHYSYIKTKYDAKEEVINNIFSIYVEPLLNDINHIALLQE